MNTVRSRRLAAFYAQRAQEEPASDPEAKLRFLKALRAADLHDDEHLLDLGSKWGGLGTVLAQRQPNARYTGLDLDPDNVQRGCSLGLDIRLGDAASRLPFADDEFDCVMALELLEHLAEPVALLEECNRVLKPSGRIVVSVPNPYSWVEIVREVLGWPDPEGHLVSFTTPVMSNVLALAGLEMTHRRGTSLRVPLTSRLIQTDSILARSRIYIGRPHTEPMFAGRTNLSWETA